MKKSLIPYVLFFLLVSFPIFSQELSIVANGTLEEGDSGYVTGDYVRIRTGPSLEYRIIAKANKGTEISIMQRGEKVEQIKNMTNYWYRIKIDKTGLEGWMYGEFIQKKEKPEEKAVKKDDRPVKVKTKIPPEEISLKEMGSIPARPGGIATGDLNNNGISEIILLDSEKNKRDTVISGFEPDSENYAAVYDIKLRNTSAESLQIIDHAVFESPVIAVSGKNFSYLYTYDHEKGIPRMIFKLDTPMITIGELNGQDPYLIYLKKNKVIDNDGTITYYVHAKKIEYYRNRITLKDEVIYQKPLPVKKLLSFDLNGDRKNEIILEIGGRNFGGGITVLGLKGESMVRLVNTGINTLNDTPFVAIWGVNFKSKPNLFIYSTDPGNIGEVNTSFGFITASFHNKALVVDNFYPVNKLLDDINNNRKIALYTDGDESFPFIILDYDQDLGTSAVKRVILN
jgi:uncharacterized protein YgiM (DUF1202 family)